MANSALVNKIHQMQASFTKFLSDKKRTDLYQRAYEELLKKLRSGQAPSMSSALDMLEGKFEESGERTKTLPSMGQDQTTLSSRDSAKSIMGYVTGNLLSTMGQASGNAVHSSRPVLETLGTNNMAASLSTSTPILLPIITSQPNAPRFPPLSISDQSPNQVPPDTPILSPIHSTTPTDHSEKPTLPSITSLGPIYVQNGSGFSTCISSPTDSPMPITPPPGERSGQSVISSTCGQPVYIMETQNRTVSDMWDEYLGRGRFAHLVGGIKGLNAKHGRFWRREYDDKMKGYYRKYLSIMEYVEAKMATNSEAQVLDQMDELSRRGKSLASITTIKRRLKETIDGNLAPSPSERSITPMDSPLTEHQPTLATDPVLALLHLSTGGPHSSSS